MLRAGWLPCPGGMPPRFDPQTQGGLASGLEGLVPSGTQPPVPPLFLLVRSNQKPQPLPYYLSEGRRSCLATRLGQIDVAEAN